MRARQMSDAEARATAATERMSLPIVLLAGGFLLFRATSLSTSASKLWLRLPELRVVPRTSTGSGDLC
jgi:hypothetical protein